MKAIVNILVGCGTYIDILYCIIAIIACYVLVQIYKNY